MKNFKGPDSLISYGKLGVDFFSICVAASENEKKFTTNKSQT